MSELLPRMARWAVALEARHLDESTLLQARILLLDTLGCALAARHHPIVRKAAAVASALMGVGPVTGLGTGLKRSPMGAVLDSGSAIRALDFNDFYWGPSSGGHPSDMFSVALAVGEENNSTLEDFLCAVVVGYDFYLRLADLMDIEPFDHTTSGAIGSAAIAAKLLNLDETRFSHALSLAMLRGPALSAVRFGHISEVKGLAAAIACLNGLLSARLAYEGVTGPVDSIEGQRGLRAFLRKDADLDHLVPATAGQPMIGSVTIKRFPSMGTSQASASVALQLHQRLNGRTERIKAMTFRISDSPLTRHQITGPYRRPNNRETADHSFPAVTAMTLADGGLSRQQFERNRFLDADVLELIDRTQFVCDLGGVNDGSYPAHVTAMLDDHSVVTEEVDYAPGHPRNPMSPDRATEKFLECSIGVLPTRAAERVCSLCLQGQDITIRDVLAELA